MSAHPPSSIRPPGGDLELWPLWVLSGRELFSSLGKKAVCAARRDYAAFLPVPSSGCCCVVVCQLYAYAFAGCEPFHSVPFAVPVTLSRFLFSVWRLPFPVAGCRLPFTLALSRVLFGVWRSPSPVIRLPLSVVCRYLPFCVLRPPSACRFASPVLRFTFLLLRVCRVAFAVSRSPSPVILAFVVSRCRLSCLSAPRLSFVV